MNTNDTNNVSTRHIRNTIVVAALGYFVDIYDLIIFSIVRVKSLTSLGLHTEEVLSQGMRILNAQMLGMLLGGVLWGVLGDKKGRLKVLFGSILLYSLANLANAYVDGVYGYMFWRFVAGVGLAGELGAGVTLVTENMSQKNRGYGVSIVAGFGILGAVLAFLLAQAFDWRSCYKIGAVLGLGLLFWRVGILESALFEKSKTDGIKRGHFWMLFQRPHLFKKYMQCIGMGIPIWFIVGILVTFADRFAHELQIQGEVLSARAVLFCYIGLSVGDFLSGILSQYLRSRKKTLFVFSVLMFVCLFAYFTSFHQSATYFYVLSFGLGVAGGYWAIFIAISAEQFGTNIRATVATTVPNFVRGSLPLLSFLFAGLQAYFSFVVSAVLTGALCLCISFVSIWFISETFHQDLDYHE